MCRKTLFPPLLLFLVVWTSHGGRAAAAGEIPGESPNLIAEPSNFLAPAIILHAPGWARWSPVH